MGCKSMAITKAIIPVAGWGTRRLPITKVVEKAMLPVGNRPLVDYTVQDLVTAGVTDIYFVVSSENSQVEQYYSENAVLNEYLVTHGKEDKLELTKTLPDGVTTHFFVQGERYGTAVPVAEVVEAVEIDEPVLVCMGDDFIWNPDGETAVESLLAAAKNGGSAILGVEVDDVSRYGVLSVAEDGMLTDIVEKPAAEEAPSNLVNVSKYVMDADLLQKVVKYVAEHDFGPLDQEYLITDPIAEYIAEGGKMYVAPTTGAFLDGGSLEGWLEANTVVLSGAP